MKYGSRDIERKRFVDTLAVRYKSSGDALQRERHVAKRKQRNKDLEIIFDPESHKDFVTGFRKRKQQRRKEAVKSLEKLQRENKLEERAERREARREQFNLAYDSPDDAHGNDLDSGNAKQIEKIFDGDEMTSTVRVSAISTGREEDEEHITQLLHDKSSTKMRTIQAEKDKKHGKGHKMSKTSLAVLSNTRLKIEGKKKFSAQNSKRNSKGMPTSKGKERNKRGKR